MYTLRLTVIAVVTVTKPHGIFPVNVQYYLTKGAAGSFLSVSTLGDMIGSSQLDNSVIWCLIN